MKSKKKKKKVTIKDIIRLIVLLVAFSVLLYPTFSSYLNEKNGSKVVSYYDEESVKLSKAEKSKCWKMREHTIRKCWEILI